MQGDYREDSAVGCVSCHHERSGEEAEACMKAAAHNIE